MVEVETKFDILHPFFSRVHFKKPGSHINVPTIGKQRMSDLISNYRGIAKLLYCELQWNNKSECSFLSPLYFTQFNFPLTICLEFKQLFLLLFKIGLHNSPDGGVVQALL